MLIKKSIIFKKEQLIRDNEEISGFIDTGSTAFSIVLFTGCNPGETLGSEYQMAWFRDVIFKTARESGRDPLLVIRDWTMNMDFRSQIRALYENSYSELKHNDER